MLKLMYITNSPAVALAAANAGVKRIFIDMETLGKENRQGHMDSVKSHHTPEDIARVRDAVGSKCEILARINPINPQTPREVDGCINNGADIIMLPMWKSKAEAANFIECVAGRAKTLLLLETREADAALTDTLALPGIDEVHIGLNDLHISYKKRFMFELLTDGTVDSICERLRANDMFFGIGGVAAPYSGTLPGRSILAEHYRLGSKMVILSRSFCDTSKIRDIDTIKSTFSEGISAIRECEREFASWSAEQFNVSHAKTADIIRGIVEAKEAALT